VVGGGTAPAAEGGAGSRGGKPPAGAEIGKARGAGASTSPSTTRLRLWPASSSSSWGTRTRPAPGDISPSLAVGSCAPETAGAEEGAEAGAGAGSAAGGAEPSASSERAAWAFLNASSAQRLFALGLFALRACRAGLREVMMTGRRGTGGREGGREKRSRKKRGQKLLEKRNEKKK